MKKNCLPKILRYLSLVTIPFLAAPNAGAEERGPFIFPGELDFLGVKDLDFSTTFLLNDGEVTEWSGEGFHTGIQQVSLSIYNCKEIPETFTVPDSPTLFFSIYDGYGEEVKTVEKDLTSVFNRIKFIHGDFLNKVSEQIAVMRGGVYTMKASITPDLFSYEVVAQIKDEAGVHVTNTKTVVDSILAPVLTITSGFPYNPVDVAGEKTLKWTVSSVDDPTKILVEDTESFDLDASKILLAAEDVLELPVSGLQPGEYIYTLTSDYAPACMTFKAYVYDVLDTEITFDKPLYMAGEDKEAKFDIAMRYGYPYIEVNTETKKPTIEVTTKFLEEDKTEKFSETAWSDSEMNYTANLSVSLEKVTQEVVEKFKGEVPLDILIYFNGQTQYQGTVNIPFKYDISGVENVSADNNTSTNMKYYNVFGVEVDSHYKGIVITSEGNKIIRK